MALSQSTQAEAPATPASTAAAGRYVAPRRPGRARIFLSILRTNPRAAIGLGLLITFILMGVAGPYVVPYDPAQLGVGMPSQSPDPHHWLGTTRTGQDIFSQLIAGARPSLIMAAIAGLLATALAAFIGLIAGYLGGWVDDGLSTFTNIFLILPMLPLMIVMSTYATAFNLRGPIVIAFVVALVSWPWGARAMRSQMLSMRSKDFVLASRSAGESWPRIVFTEVMPNMLSIVAANFIFATLAAFVAEIGLEFIGLGDTAQISWGSMLYWAQVNASLIQGAWYWFIPPGICIGLFALSLVLLNYAVDEIANPRLRTERARHLASDSSGGTPVLPGSTK